MTFHFQLPLLFGALLFSLLLAGCGAPKTVREHMKFMEREIYGNPNIASHQLEQDGFSLHYLTAGTQKTATVLWIHGTPGSAADIGHLFTNRNFLAEIKLVSIDRPGWEKSQLSGTPHMLPAFADQERYIKPLIQKLKSESPDLPLILAGHSWGASLVPYLAAHNRESVDGLLLVSGGFSPELMKPRWYHHYTASRWTRWSVPEILRDSNEEMMLLPQELSALEQVWPKLSNLPVYVLQGRKDRLVDYRNMDTVSNHIDPEFITLELLESDGHLLQIKRTDRIISALMQLANP